MKITVITATYNSAATLRSTIESVGCQKYNGEIEYIIMDGGSTDQTLDIISQYPNIVTKVVSQPDKGLYDAMNKGIALATGDVIGILNSDDFYTSDDVLSVIADEFANKSVDAVYGDIHFVNPNNLTRCVRYYSSATFSPWTLRFGIMPAHPSFYVNHECYERYGAYDLNYRIASDYDLMVRFFYKHKITYSYVKKDMVTMRTGGVSTRNVRNRLLITQEDVKACRKHGLYTNVLFVSLKYFCKIFELRIV